MPARRGLIGELRHAVHRARLLPPRRELRDRLVPELAQPSDQQLRERLDRADDEDAKRRSHVVSLLVEACAS